jgi:7-cyano-7-deazaguanine synthase
MKAVVLLSGGLDSAVLLAHALAEGRECYTLSFYYNQRHNQELKAAQLLSEYYGVPHKVIAIDVKAFGDSALTSDIELEKNRNIEEIVSSGVPNTYVPARNTIFLSYAMAQAEVIGAEEIYIGVNAVDSHGYPDTRKEYIEAFQNMMNYATCQALQGRATQLIAPFIDYDKPAIMQRGAELAAPLNLTISCYDPLDDFVHCGECDACVLRKQGFITSNIEDPTLYC